MDRLGLFLMFSIVVPMVISAQSAVDFQEANIAIQVNPQQQSIEGMVDYQLYALQRTDSVVIDARQMEIKEVFVNRRKVDFLYDDQRIMVYKKFKENKDYELSISYKARPKKAVYFLGWEDEIPDNNQVWTQGQGKYSSHWVPSFDNMSEKVIFNMEISMDKSYEVAANGILRETELRDSIKVWRYSMDKPMSSYLLAFAVGFYEKDTLTTTSGVPIILYSYPDSIDKREPTYRYTAEIMDFLENEMGVDYPWQNYKQIPVRDFLYAGMENTGATIFSDSFVIDSTAFIDKNYVNINAHEMAHQWFGNLVTEEASKDHWLHEGFASYYALLAEKKIFGEDYFYWKLFRSAEALKNYDGEALTDPKASSLTFYEKGAWALVVLQDLIGDLAFKKSVEVFLKTYEFSNATVQDFLEIAHRQSGLDLEDFKSVWLLTDEFPYDKARDYLIGHSTSLKAWYDIRWELTVSSLDNELIIKSYWKDSRSNHFKRQVLSKFIKSLSPEFIREIINTDHVEIRRAVAVYMERIPAELKEDFESMLQDPSYITLEHALFKLWIYFPDGRSDYLDSTRDIYGLPNYNLRILWLFLAVLTNDFDSDEARSRYKEELFGYTSAIYSNEIRQNAFAVITEVFDLPEQNLKDLVNASVHHSWQFRDYARKLLKDIMKDEDQRNRLEEIAGELNEKEQRYLIKELETK